MRAVQEKEAIQKAQEANKEAEDTNKLKSLLNAFEGTEIFEQLQAKAKELDLLSNPDIKKVEQVVEVKDHNEWEERLKLEEVRLAQLKEAHE